MTTQTIGSTSLASAPLPRAHAIWQVGAQGVALAVLALALWWATATAAGNAVDNPEYSPVPIPAQVLLLAAFAALTAVITLVPAWRRSVAAVVAGSGTLAVACWTAMEHYWNAPFLAENSVPLLAPVLLGAVALVGVGALVTRAYRCSPFSAGAMISGLLVGGLGLALFTLLLRIDALKALYAVDPTMLQAPLHNLLGLVVLFPLALWLGSIGIRPHTRWLVQPLGTVIIVGIFLGLWWLRAHGGQG